MHYTTGRPLVNIICMVYRSCSRVRAGWPECLAHVPELDLYYTDPPQHTIVVTHVGSVGSIRPRSSCVRRVQTARRLLPSSFPNNVLPVSMLALVLSSSCSLLGILGEMKRSSTRARWSPCGRLLARLGSTARMTPSTSCFVRRVNCGPYRPVLRYRG